MFHVYNRNKFFPYSVYPFTDDDVCVRCVSFVSSSFALSIFRFSFIFRAHRFHWIFSFLAIAKKTVWKYNSLEATDGSGGDDKRAPKHTYISYSLFRIIKAWKFCACICFCILNTHCQFCNLPSTNVRSNPFSLRLVIISVCSDTKA